MNIEELRKEAKTKKVSLRSCWNCNPAHEYFKESDYVIACIWCGHYFYKGVDITDTSKENQGGESMTKLEDIYVAEVGTKGVYVNIVTNSESPYIPFGVLLDKNRIVVDIQQDGEEYTKIFEWRDLLIMHKALTRIFGKKPKRKRKA